MKANNIFRNLVFVFSLLLITTKANSQGTTHTPMGQTVYLVNNGDTPALLAGWEAAAAQWITNNNSDAIRIASATSNYNCHAYAWNVVEGGSSSNAWLNQTYNGGPNLSKYWTNDGYTSTPTVSDHEKIFYSLGDHSAITTATSGKVRSKWGAWPRYEHSTSQCPYSSGNLQYYKLVNPTVSGSSEALCNNSQRTFSESSFTNISLNYDWSTTSPLSEVSGDGTSSYTVAGTSQNGLGVISLKITTPSGATATVSKNVWAGMPTNNEISFGVFFSPPPYNQVIRNQPMQIGIINNPNANLQRVTGYQWQFLSSMSWIPYIKNYQSSGGYANSLFNLFLTSSANSHQVITVSAENACGCNLNYSAEDQMFYTVDRYYLTISPNPVSSETIMEIITGAGEVSGFDTEWDLEVYDSMQSLKAKTQKIKGNKQTINTSGWKDGVYIVRAKVGKEILSEKMVVKH